MCTICLCVHVSVSLKGSDVTPLAQTASAFGVSSNRAGFRQNVGVTLRIRQTGSQPRIQSGLKEWCSVQSFDVVAWCSFPPAGDKTEAIWRRRRHRPSQSVSVEARLWRVCASCSVYVTDDYLTWWKLRVRIFFQFPRVFGFHLKRFEWPNLRVSRRASFVWKPEICQSFSL